MEMKGWFSSTKAVEIEYSREYEPYVVFRRPLAAEFPAEFMGRGFNKAAMVFALHAAGYRFYTLPKVWVVDEVSAVPLLLPFVLMNARRWVFFVHDGSANI
jgi:hypothetical protein